MNEITIAVLLLGALLAGTLLGVLAGLAVERVRSQSRVLAAEQAAAGASATLAAERAAAEQRLADARREQARLVEQFQAVSAGVLREGSAAFLDLAEQRLRQEAERASGELARRQQAVEHTVEHLVDPIAKTLGKVEAQLGAAEQARAAADADLRAQVTSMGQASEALRGETARLVGALRAPHVRGRWGEMQLRRTVEAAGMVEHCDFTEQAHVAGPDGALRPDLVVHLAGGKQIVVDSKVPLDSWLAANETTDDAVRAARMTAHARSVRGHVDALSAKAYWERFDPCPELVVLFLPADTFLDAALRQDPALLEHAFGRNVVLATPTTLVTLLRTVGYAWRQEAVARNAQQVLVLGRDLYARLATMGSHVTKLGSSLTRAVSAYNDTVGSLESRVLVTARRLTELHVNDQPLDELTPVDKATRPVAAVELVASSTESLVALAGTTLGRGRTGT